MAVGALQERRIAMTGEVCDRIFVHALMQKCRDKKVAQGVQVIGFRQTDFREQGFQVLAERVRMDGCVPSSFVKMYSGNGMPLSSRSLILR